MGSQVNLLKSWIQKRSVETSTQWSSLQPNYCELILSVKCQLMVSFLVHWVYWIWKRWCLHLPRCNSFLVAGICQQPVDTGKMLNTVLENVFSKYCNYFINIKTHLGCTFAALFLKVTELHHLSHDEAFLKVSVDLSGSLRGLSPFLMEQNSIIFHKSQLQCEGNVAIQSNCCYTTIPGTNVSLNGKISIKRGDTSTQ